MTVRLYRKLNRYLLGNYNVSSFKVVDVDFK